MNSEPTRNYFAKSLLAEEYNAVIELNKEIGFRVPVWPYSETPISEAFGIITENKCVIEISLSNLQMESIPQSVLKFKHLNRLYCNNNKITSIPGKLFENKNLEVLSLDGNLIDTKGLPNIQSGPSIEFLTISLKNNRIEMIEPLFSWAKSLSLDIQQNPIQNLGILDRLDIQSKIRTINLDESQSTHLSPAIKDGIYEGKLMDKESIGVIRYFKEKQIKIPIVQGHLPNTPYIQIRDGKIISLSILGNPELKNLVLPSVLGKCSALEWLGIFSKDNLPKEMQSIVFSGFLIDESEYRTVSHLKEKFKSNITICGMPYKPNPNSGMYLEIERRHSIKLNLDNAGLSEYPSQLDLLKTLTSLILSNNQMKILPSTAFASPQLKILNLAYNPIQEIQLDDKIHNEIEEIILDGNKIEKIPVQLVKYPKLRTLSMKYNKLSEIPIDFKEFFDGTRSKSLGKTCSLAIDRCPIQKIDDWIINLMNFSPGLPKDQYIQLNILNFIQKMVFGNQQSASIYENKVYSLTIEIDGKIPLPVDMKVFNSLIKLTISGSNIEKIPEWVFSFEMLEDLTIEKTKIASIPDEIGKLKNLKSLSLGYSSIEYVSRNISKCTKLTKLLLSGNKIGEIPDSIGELTELVIVKLQNNKLKTLPETLGKCNKIIELTLTGNPFEKLPKSLLNLKRLRHFAIDQVDLIKKEFPKDFYYIFRLPQEEVKALDVIESIVKKKLMVYPPKSTRYGVESGFSVEELEFEDKTAPKLPDGTYQKYTENHVTELSLMSFNSESLPIEISKLEYLRKLNIANSKIQNIEKAFSNLKNLRDLIISGSEIQFIHDDVKTLENLKITGQWTFKLVQNEIEPLRWLIDEINNKTGRAPLEAVDIDRNLKNLIYNGGFGITSGHVSHLGLKNTDEYNYETRKYELKEITELPIYLKELKCLKYLDLSNSSVKMLPEYLSNHNFLSRIEMPKEEDYRNFPSSLKKLFHLGYRIEPYAALNFITNLEREYGVPVKINQNKQDSIINIVWDNQKIVGLQFTKIDIPALKLPKRLEIDKSIEHLKDLREIRIDHLDVHFDNAWIKLHELRTISIVSSSIDFAEMFPNPKEYHKLENLRTIAITDCTINVIKEIYTIPRLTSLEFINCKIPKMEMPAVENNSIETLTFSGIQGPITITGIEKLKNLKEFKIEKSTIEIDTDITKLKHLRSISIVDCETSNLPNSIFYGPALENITIVRCKKIQKIPDFKGNGKYRIIDLSDNNISMLPESLGFIANVSNLNLSNNALSSLPALLYKVTLGTLDLRNNRFKHIDETIQDSTNISTILLDGNPLETILKVELRKEMESFSKLNITQEERKLLSEISIKLKRNNQKLSKEIANKELYISYSNKKIWIRGYSLNDDILKLISKLSIESIEIKDCNLSDEQFLAILNSFDDFTNINVVGNHISKLPERLTTFKSLKELFLTNNPIKSTDPVLIRLFKENRVNVSINFPFSANLDPVIKNNLRKYKVPKWLDFDENEKLAFILLKDNQFIKKKDYSTFNILAFEKMGPLQMYEDISLINSLQSLKHIEFHDLSPELILLSVSQINSEKCLELTLTLSLSKMEDIKPFIETIGNIPKCKKLILSSFIINGKELEKTNWHKIDTLCLTQCTISNFEQFIAHLPNLKDFTLDNNTYDDINVLWKKADWNARLIGFRIDHLFNTITPLPDWIYENQNLQYLEVGAFIRISEALTKNENLKSLVLKDKVEYPPSLLSLPNLEEFSINQARYQPEDVLSGLYNSIYFKPEDLAFLKEISNRNIYFHLNLASETKTQNNKKQKWNTSEILYEKGRIQSIYLSRIKLKSLPETITWLKKLKTLLLPNNFLESLPKGFSNLVELEELDLSENNFSELPEELYSLHDLKKLNLSVNKIRVIPDKIINLQNLEELIITRNFITEISPNIGKLPRLKTLVITANKFSTLPESITELSNIQEIDISYNPLYLSEGIQQWLNKLKLEKRLVEM